MRIGSWATIAAAGVLGAAAFTASGIATGPPRAVAQPDAPSVGRAARPFIKHVVVVVMENRTFDNLFGGPAITTPPAPGTPLPLHHPLPPPYPGADSVVPAQVVALATSVPLEQGKVDNTHDAFACLNESTPGRPRFSTARWIAVSQHATPDPAAVCTDPARWFNFFEFVPRSQRTIYWQIARAYGLGDRFFAATSSASYPPHQFIVAGDVSFFMPFEKWIADQPGPGNGCWGPFKPSPGSQYLAPVVGPSVFETNAPVPDYRAACYSRPTYGDRFSKANVSWIHYTTALPTQPPSAPSATGVKPTPIVHAFDGFTNIHAWYRKTLPLPTAYPSTLPSPYPSPAASVHFFETTQILDDAKHGYLPQFAWVKPPCIKQSDHPGANGHQGPNWVGSVINAIGSNRKLWQSTVIFVMWDDWGGFYDHVTPPAPPPNQLGRGARIPFLVVSPYLAHPGRAVHTEGHPGSIMRFANELFDAQPLTAFDRDAPDLTGWFDFHAHLIAHPFVPIAGAAAAPWQNSMCNGSGTELVD